MSNTDVTEKLHNADAARNTAGKSTVHIRTMAQVAMLGANFDAVRISAAVFSTAFL